MLAGTGLGLLHAYDGATGQDAPGFPKTTGGWLFSPAALSDDGRMAGITREGYLFEWDSTRRDMPDRVADVPARPAEQRQLRPRRHRARRHPGHALASAARRDTTRLTFKSPGDDGFCGDPTAYSGSADGTGVDLGPPAAGGQAVTRAT